MGLRRRNVLLSALAVLGMFSVLGMSCSITGQPYTGPPNAPTLYVGGDSITNGAIDDINAQFQPAYQVRIDGWGGGDSSQMAPRVQAAAASAPDVAVIELGTNDPVPHAPHQMTLGQSETTLQAMAAAFPSSTCVIFVTPWSGTVSRPAGSLAAIDGFERATFAHVADWDAAVVPDDYANTDDVHPNHTGNLHLMQVEATAIASCPPPVTTTSTTDTTSTIDTTTSTVDSTTSSTDTTSTVDTTTSSTDTTSTVDTTTSSTDTTP